MQLGAKLRRIGAYETALRVARENGLTLLEAFGREQHRRRGWRPSKVRARDQLLAVLRWSTRMSLSEIGEILDIDHSAVALGVKRHEQRLNGERE